MNSKLFNVFREVFPESDIDEFPRLEREECDFWDSLKNLELMITIEHSFDIRFTLKQLEKISSAQDILDILNEQ